MKSSTVVILLIIVFIITLFTYMHLFPQKKYVNQTNQLNSNNKYIHNSSTCRPFDYFDPEFYLGYYDDLGNAFGNDLEAATKHWLKQGKQEGRIGCRGCCSL